MKKILLMILVLILLSSSVSAVGCGGTSCVPEINQDNLILWFNFNNTNAKIVNYGNTTVVNNFTCSNTPVIGQADPYGGTNAYDFEKTNDELCEDSTERAALGGLNDYTVVLWIKPEDDVGTEYFIEGDESGGGAGNFEMQAIVDDTYQMRMSQSTATTTTLSKITNTAWTMVVARRNGTNQTIFINGSDENAEIVSTTVTVKDNPNLRVHICQTSTDTLRCDGMLADLSWWGRALTDDEIQCLYDGNCELPTLPPTIINPSPEDNSANNTNVTINVSHSSTLNDIRYYLYFGTGSTLTEGDLFLNNVTPDGVNQSSGLVAYYPFNINNTLDYSYFGNDGTNNGTTWNATGGVNDTGGFEFDGVDDYVKINVNTTTLLGNNFSYSLWINSETSDSTFRNVIGSNWNSQGSFVLYHKTGTLTASLKDETNTEVKTTSTFNSNEWVHISFTFNGSDTVLYINGNEVGSTNIVNGFIQIGNKIEISSSSNDFNGSIDEVAIYNRSLSAAEINELFLQSAFRYDGTDNHKTFLTNVSDGVYFWKWKVQNISGGGAFSANTTQRTWTLDTVIPTITILTNNSWKTDNTTIISSHLHNLTINVSFFDINLFQTLVNITNESDKSIFIRLNTSITGTTINVSEVVDISNLSIGNYTIKLVATDSHTASQISSYDVRGGINYFRYTTEEGNVIKIKSDNFNLFTKSTTKLKDRYSFEFNYLFQEDTYTFTIESYNKIQYIKDSDYNAHFVIIGKNGRGNWIDFENPNLDNKDYKITKIDDYTYEVEITANGIKSFNFNSLGGLNTAEEHYKFQIGAVLDVWVGNSEDGGTGINATVTIGTQSSNTTINTTAARLINITKDITSLTLTSSGFGTEEKTIAITQSFHNFTFNMTPVNSAKLSFFDENSEALIVGESFSVFMETTGFSQIFSGITDNPHSITELPNGLYKLKASSSNYPERQYLDLNISNTTTTLLNIYLINNTLGSEVTFSIVSKDGLAPLENVRTIFTKTINGTKTIVAEEESDFAGQVVVTLDENTQYTINFSKTNFEVRIIQLEPKNSDYLIQLVSTVGAYNQSVHEGIRYRFEPVNTVLNNNTKFNFTFTLNSTVWEITNCTLRLKNGTILLSETSSFVSTGCFIRIEQDTFNMTNITAEAIYVLDSQFEFTVSQQYKILFTYVGQFSLKNFLDDLSDFGMAGFDDFGRMILALIVIFIITALAAQKIGFSNPEVLIFLVVAQVWFFSSVNWLFLDFAPIPTIAGFNLKKYIIAILVSMAGGAFVVKKFTE